jgi:hypothetical protein
MTKQAENALAILKKNLGYQDMLDLIELLQAHLEEESQMFIKVDTDIDVGIKEVRSAHE